jgi:hypothetical protein
MTYGIKFINDSGVTQIDDSTNSCLSFKNKGIIDYNSMAADSNMAGVRYYDLSGVGDVPLIALRIPPNTGMTQSAAVGIANVSKVGAFWTFRVALVTAYAVNVDWWVFDRPADVTSGFGIVVYDANGRVTINGSERLISVHGALADGGSTGVVNVARIYAIAGNIYGDYQEQINVDEDGNLEFIAVTTVKGWLGLNGGIEIQQFTQNIASGQGGSGPGYPGTSVIKQSSAVSGMVIDVTDY